MICENKVVWSEGMFLQPQHFQQQDRYYESQLRRVPSPFGLNGWGMTQLEIDHEQLENGVLALRTCAGTLPDGIAFIAPDQDQLPEPLAVPENISDTIVYLATPLKHPNSAEIGQKEQALRYIAETAETNNNVLANDGTQEIEIAKLHLRLVLASDDLSGYSKIAIAKIKESSINKKVILDQNFLPTCLDIKASPRLLKAVAEVHELLNHRAEMLAHRLTDTKQSANSELTDFMLLQLVNRNVPLFHHLSHHQGLHPESLYGHLIQLLGEIATFTNDKRRVAQMPIYKHDDLSTCYSPVLKAMRHALSMVLEQNAVAIKLHEKQYGVWVAEVNEPELLQNCEFVLAAYADVPMDMLRNSFSHQIKIAPVEHIRNLVSRALPGIDLQIMPVAPRQIPYHANFTYFRLNRQSPMWMQLDKSAGIAFHIGGNFPGLKLELWAIKG